MKKCATETEPNVTIGLNEYLFLKELKDKFTENYESSNSSIRFYGAFTRWNNEGYPKLAILNPDETTKHLLNELQAKNINNHNLNRELDKIKSTFLYRLILKHFI